MVCLTVTDLTLLSHGQEHFLRFFSQTKTITLVDCLQGARLLTSISLVPVLFGSAYHNNNLETFLLSNIRSKNHPIQTCHVNCHEIPLRFYTHKADSVSQNLLMLFNFTIRLPEKVGESGQNWTQTGTDQQSPLSPVCVWLV